MVALHDNGGRVSRITDPGSYFEYVYNARNWLTEVRNRTTGGTTRYDATYYYQDGTLWDHTGNPLKRVENLAGSTYTTTLRYDAVYRQTEETKRDSGNNVLYSLGYGYDAVGNRTTRTLGGTTTTYGYDENNKLLTVNGTTSCAYDANGNMTSSFGNLPSRTMVYDDDNNLTSVTYGGTTDLYFYNGMSQRYRARLSGTYYRYLYSHERVLEELNDSGTMQARYTTEDGSYSGMLLHLYRPSGSLSRFPMYDNIGSARGLLDASGTATDWYELDTFGRQVSTSGTTPNPYRYGGAWGYITDPSGLAQLGLRYYWPELGQLLQQDPIRGRNSGYAYAEANPVTAIDPNGMVVKHCGAPGMTKPHEFIYTEPGCIVNGKRGNAWGFSRRNNEGNWLGTDGMVRNERGKYGQPFDPNKDCHEQKCIDPKKLCDEMNKSAQDPPRYRLFGYQCRDWVRDMFDKAKIPGCDDCPGPTPNSGSGGGGWGGGPVGGWGPNGPPRV